MSGFGKNKGGVNPRSSLLQDQAARIIATRLLYVQRVWAAWMQRQTEKLSPSGKHIALVIFCITTAIGIVLSWQETAPPVLKTTYQTNKPKYGSTMPSDSLVLMEKIYQLNKKP